MEGSPKLTDEKGAPIPFPVDITALPENTRQEYFMKQAFIMAKKALDEGETPVGCVIVLNDQILGYGMNDTNRSMNGTRHAEFLAIAEVLQSYPKSILQSTELYVTVEPCIMCASVLRQYGFRHVYFGCLNERFGGTGGVVTLHSDPSIDPPYASQQGIFKKEAVLVLRRFYVQENPSAPKPRKKHRGLNTHFEG